MKILLQKANSTFGSLLVLVATMGAMFTTESVANDKKLKVADAKVVFCEALPAPTTGRVCDVTPGSPALLIKGNVLGATKIFQGGEVLVDQTGLIRYVGCSADRDAALDGLAASATGIECANGVISPGLINSHEHLTFDQNHPMPPSANPNDRYDHRNDWRVISNIPQDFSQPRVTWSELRQAMVGTTSIAGGGGSPGVVRNLDLGNYPLFDDLLWNVLAGEPPTVIASDTFPLEAGNDFTQNVGDCSNYPDFPFLAGAATFADAYVPHVAEGINAAAQNEFACLSSTDNNGVDVMNRDAALIHGIALDADDGNTLASQGAKLIWSPRSNMALYGNTAPVTMLKKQGVLLSLGTDWTATGSMHLGREMLCADELNQTYYDTTFSNRDLWLMVTYNPAVSLQVDNKIGSLTAGLFGDIAIFDGTGMEDPFRAVIEANADNMVLVLRRSALPSPLVGGPLYVGSVAIYGDALAMQSLPPTFHDIIAPGRGVPVPLCESINVCGVPKSICPLRETWWVGGVGAGFSPMSLSYDFLNPLDTANASSYGLFFCDDPIDEPTCVPFRSGEYDGTIVSSNDPVKDRDGDGIPDPADNCKKVFNPIRPMDGGVQADADSDGQGDACDDCPLEAGETCSAVDPYTGAVVTIDSSNS